MGEVMIVDSGQPVRWQNQTGLPDHMVEGGVREVARKLTDWVSLATQPGGSMFERNTYTANTNNPYDLIRTARQSVKNDDIVGGLADVTEGLIFQGVQWESSSSDDTDVFNQLAAKQNLDGIIREAYRTLFTDSQVVFASWWMPHEFKMRGRNSEKVQAEDGTIKVQTGRSRKKKITAVVPTHLTILDSLKVVPIGNRMWGYDRLAWHVTPDEYSMYTDMLGNPGLIHDPVMSQLFLAPYRPDRTEAGQIESWGIDSTRLIELNPRYVWRHTLTKPTYEPFADVRLSSVFRLLDLKHQLMEADRVALIGAANYILLVKKGTDALPGDQEEINNLKENFDVMAKLPVIVADHRLNIEIITPKQDYTLQSSKYDVLDSRILARILGSIGSGVSSRREASSSDYSRAISRLLESRRHMLKRTLESHLARAIVDLDANSDKFTTEPNLAYTPRTVQTDSDNAAVQAVLALRTQKELSRKSLLEYFGFDQEIEAQRRQIEEDAYDPIFKTQIPFSSPALDTPLAPQVSGAQGGRPVGGGEPKDNPTVLQP